MFSKKTDVKVFVPMKIIICDDNPAFMQELNGLLQDYSILNDWECQCDLYQFPEELLETDLSEAHVIFLDIDMPGKNGLDVAKKLREKYPDIIIVFVTAFIEYAPAGYCVEAFRYLLKNSLRSELSGCLAAIEKKLYTDKEGILVQQSNRRIHVLLKEILYFEGTSQRRVLLHFHSKQPKPCAECVGKLSEYEHRLQDMGFLRIQRSYIVNVRYINKINNYLAYLCNGEKLKVSERSYSQVCRQYLMWKGDHL